MLKKSLLVITVLFIICILTVSETYADITTKSKDDFAVWKAVMNNDFDKVKEMIEKDPSLLKAKFDEDKYYKSLGGRNEKNLLNKPQCSNFDFYPHSSLLHFAVFWSNLKMVKLLVSKGIPVNVISRDKTTPLHIVVATDKIDIAEFLISRGANINAGNSYYLTPLHNAVNENRYKMAAFLLSRGADVSAAGYYNMRPIHFAANRSCDLKILKLMVDNGADVNAENSGGLTSLYYALSSDLLFRYGPKTKVEYLVSKGADVNITNTNGKHLLIECFDYPNEVKMAKILIASGANINYIDRKGESILEQTISAGRRELISILISKGAKIRVSTILLTIKKKDWETLKIICTKSPQAILFEAVVLLIIGTVLFFVFHRKKTVKTENP